MMKKYTSVASLTISQTALPASLVMLAAALLQWLLYQPDTVHFEHSLGLAQSLVTLGGLLALAAVLIFRCCALYGTRCDYRLYLLQVSPNAVTLLRAALFIGYFFLYWLAQLAMVFALYFRFMSNADSSAVLYQGPDLLSLLSYCSPLFHTLLPLADWPGYLRNIALCISYGCTTAFLAHHIGFYKQRKTLFWGAMLVLATLIWLPAETAQWQSCLYFSLAAVAVPALLYCFILRGVPYEE